QGDGGRVLSDVQQDGVRQARQGRGGLKLGTRGGLRLGGRRSGQTQGEGGPLALTALDRQIAVHGGRQTTRGGQADARAAGRGDGPSARDEGIEQRLDPAG